MMILSKNSMTKPKYKVGDRVRFIRSSGGESYVRIYSTGDTAIVTALDPAKDCPLEVSFDGKRRNLHMSRIKHIELATTLKELDNTVVHCKTKEEYDELMEIYEEGGWKSNRPSHCWKENGEEVIYPQHVFRWINVYDGFCGNRFSTDEYANGSESYGKEEITLQEFKRLQGLKEKAFKNIKWTKEGSALIMSWGDYKSSMECYSQQITPTNLPPSNMSIVQKVRKSRINPDERARRKAGTKDSQGNWTTEAHTLVLDKICDQPEYTKYLTTESKKHNKEEEDE